MSTCIYTLDMYNVYIHNYRSLYISIFELPDLLTLSVRAAIGQPTYRPESKSSRVCLWYCSDSKSLVPHSLFVGVLKCIVTRTV